MVLKVLLLFFVLSCSNHKTYFQPPKEGHEAYSDNLMIATQGPYATKAGLKMFQMGGNAFDAAVAISFVISVERPQSTGIGGGGFMVYLKKGQSVPSTLDFREVAPKAANSKMYLDESGKVIKNLSLNGILAGGVPGLVDGLLKIHKEHGKLPLKAVMEPAIDLAQSGFKVYPHLHKAIRKRIGTLKKYKDSTKIFLKKGRALKVGETIYQKDLAKTLRSIANFGRAGFYEGKAAKAFVKMSRKYKGLITLDDMKNYQSKKRVAVSGNYKDYKVYSMGPPSSGGIHVIQILNMIEKDNLKQYGFLHPKSVHLISSSMQQAFADRAKYLGDADFVKVPVNGLKSKKYAAKMRRKIGARARKTKKVKAGNPFPYESDETTHFTVADKDGNVISSTQTINGWLGSGVVIEGTGVVLNNEMDDFATKAGASNLFGAIGGSQNLVEPNKRPLSSMSPTIVMKDGKPYIALGTPSGTRILTCVAQTLINYLEFELPLFESVAGLRFHHQWSPDYLRVEAPGFPKETHKALRKIGHTVKTKNLGCKVQAISFEDGELHGVSDPRGEGLARGI